MGTCVVSGHDDSTNIINTLSKEEASVQGAKILLLGSGDSGKSTYIKQLKAIHYQDLPALEKYRAVVYIKENLLNGMKLLLQHCDVNSEPFQTAANEVKSAHEPSNPALEAVYKLWQFKEIQDVYAKRTSLRIDIDSNLHHFFERIPTVISDRYLPTIDDILLTRVKTTGVSETLFEVKVNGQVSRIQVIDVGGQKSERRKWIHHFSDVDLVIFFFSLDGYATVNEEHQVKVEDDLELFDQLMALGGSLSLKNWFVFLNKSDLFQKGVETMPLDKYFKDVSPENGKSFEYGVQYFQDLLTKKWKGQNLNFFVTNCLDRAQVEMVFYEAYNKYIQNFSDALIPKDKP